MTSAESDVSDQIIEQVQHGIAIHQHLLVQAMQAKQEKAALEEQHASVISGLQEQLEKAHAALAQERKCAVAAEESAEMSMKHAKESKAAADAMRVRLEAEKKRAHMYQELIQSFTNDDAETVRQELQYERRRREKLEKYTDFLESQVNSCKHLHQLADELHETDQAPPFVSAPTRSIATGNSTGPPTQSALTPNGCFTRGPAAAARLSGSMHLGQAAPCHKTTPPPSMDPSRDHSAMNLS